MATNFYIYYRVAPGAQALARERVGVLLDRVRRESGAHGRLLRKRGEDDLWMEIYEAVPDEPSFAASLDAGVCELALNEVLMQGWSRRLECFED
jgi:hypothetical protein